MSIPSKIQSFLEHERVQYEVLSHRTTFTAQETAASIHAPGREVAKPVIVKDGKEGRSFAMAVTDAPHLVNLQRFAGLTGMQDVRLAEEQEIRLLFPDCEPGAMPPLGNLYGLPTYVDRKLEEDEFISFNAGSHTEVVRMRYDDFKRLVHPQVGSFALGA